MAVEVRELRKCSGTQVADIGFNLIMDGPNVNFQGGVLSKRAFALVTFKWSQVSVHTLKKEILFKNHSK